MAECLRWTPDEGPSDYQLEILRAVSEHRRGCVRGPHGLGKSAMAAWIVLWFALTRDGQDWKVVTTASVWRQLSVYLWPEIHKWSRRIRWDVVGREPFTADELLLLQLKLVTGSANAVASDNHESIEGAHADQILYVFDESKAIPAAIFDAAEGAFSSGVAYAVAISTPGEPAGRFFEIQTRKPGF